MHSLVVVPTRLVAGLSLLAFAACSQATPPAAAAATSASAAASTAPAVLGSWARSPDSCKRPEFLLHATDVAIQTDGDGSPVTFNYRNVAWSTDAQGQVTVQLNQAHPYGKAPDKKALTFKVVGPDDIEMVQRTHPVPLHRCPAA